MKIETKIENDTIVITVQKNAADKYREKYAAVINKIYELKDINHVILYFKNCKSVSSASIGIFLRLFRHLNNLNKTFKIMYDLDELYEQFELNNILLTKTITIEKIKENNELRSD